MIDKTAQVEKLEILKDEVLKSAEYAGEDSPLTFLSEVVVFYMAHCDWMDENQRVKCSEEFFAINSLLKKCVEYSKMQDALRKGKSNIS